MAAGGIPSPKELDNLSKEICDCWQSLGIQLGVELARIDSILNDQVQFPNLERKTFAMLKSWYDKGSSSTYDALSKALRNVDKTRLAEIYCSKESKSVQRDQSPTNSPFDVHVINTRPRYRAVATFGSYGSGNGELKYPRGIAVNRAGEVAVADEDNNRVQIFSSDGRYLRTFGSKGTGDGKFSSLKGLAYNKAGHLVVGDYCNCRIQVFSPTRCWISKFGQHVLKGPWGVSITSDDNVVVCDHEQKTVSVFSLEGVLRLQFSPGTKPRSAIFFGEKYFVSGGGHVIKVFDSRGSHLYDIGEGRNEAELFKDARGLAVYTDDLLLVCDGENRCVQVVTLDGEFVTSFGSRGSGLGQFGNPDSIAVSRDGRVFVTDFPNHRVQVFQAYY